ncbi:MAG TPA: hypothetical protein VHM28_06275 [Anaerolineales bacterium]|nr:hypothetical protein [Anaerolineales bacterium]
MHVGMLWFDNTPSTNLKAKIEKAIAYYRQKYHREPNLCLIHPSMMGEDKRELSKLALDDIKGMTVRPYRPVLPGHLWIGIEDKS